MPTFYTEDLDISVDEFLSSCDSHDITELITSLIEDGHLPNNSIPKQKQKLGVLEAEFFEKIDKLKNVYYHINNEDLELIDNLVRKYC